MILIKKIYLFILAALVIVLLVYGEIRFFLTLESVRLSHNLQVKYEVENFIFASIVLALAVGLFLIFFIKKSDNVLKRLDKMIDLSEYGKYDISGHLKRLGQLGEKIRLILRRSEELSYMKSLKISSQTNIVDLLIEKYKAPLFLLNRHGNLVDCSKEFLDMMNTERNIIIKKGFNEIFKEMSYEDLFFDIEKVRDHITKKGATAEFGDVKKRLDLNLYPIANAEGQISHIIVIAEK